MYVGLQAYWGSFERPEKYMLPYKLRYSGLSQLITMAYCSLLNVLLNLKALFI